MLQSNKDELYYFFKPTYLSSSSEAFRLVSQVLYLNETNYCNFNSRTRDEICQISTLCRVLNSELQKQTVARHHLHSLNHLNSSPVLDIMVKVEEKCSTFKWSSVTKDSIRAECLQYPLSPEYPIKLKSTVQLNLLSWNVV